MPPLPSPSSRRFSATTRHVPISHGFVNVSASIHHVCPQHRVGAAPRGMPPPLSRQHTLPSKSARGSYPHLPRTHRSDLSATALPRWGVSRICRDASLSGACPRPRTSALAGCSKRARAESDGSSCATRRAARRGISDLDPASSASPGIAWPWRRGLWRFGLAASGGVLGSESGPHERRVDDVGTVVVFI